MTARNRIIISISISDDQPVAEAGACTLRMGPGPPKWLCLLSLLGASIAASPSSQLAGGDGYLLSTALGVSSCSVMGRVEGRDVKLHTWLRIRSSSEGHRGYIAKGARVSLHVRGFALLLDSQSVPKPGEKLVQLKNSEGLATWYPKLTLRSAASGASYPLEVRVRPGQPSAVIDVWGTLDVPREDARLRVWELTVEGFPWVCALTLQPPALSHTAWEPQLRTASSRPSASRKEATLTRRQLRQRKTPQVVFFLAHYFDVAAQEYATLLWHHVTWHRKLGIRQYLLYVNRHLAPLLQNRLIQELQQQGVLQIVLFVDIPRLASGSTDPHVLYIEHYALQTLINNHAVLALWRTNHMMLIADLDEFVITHKPMSINQVFTECVPAPRPTKPIGGLRITRDNAVCAPSAPACTNNQSYWSSWMSSSAEDVSSGKLQHPMNMVVPQGRLDPGFHKLLLLPDLTMSTQVHSMSMRPGADQADADNSCVRLLHLYNMHTWRPILATYRLRLGLDEVQRWMWPLAAPYNATSFVAH